MTFIIGGTVLVAAHKLFHLITWMPDNVLRWVGQNMQNLGEKEDEGRTRTIMAGAVSKGEGTAIQAFRPGGGGGKQGDLSGDGRQQAAQKRDTANLSQQGSGGEDAGDTKY